MADAMQRGESLFLVNGAIRELHDGRLYVVTDNGFLEDMREVILCHDCKHYKLDCEIDRERKYCTKFSNANEEPILPGDYDFCAWGERRNQ